MEWFHLSVSELSRAEAALECSFSQLSRDHVQEMSKERGEDAETLERLAVEELLRDAAKGSDRANSFGSTAWQKSTAPKANKIFLSRALAGTVVQNHWRDPRPGSRRTVDLDEREDSRRRESYGSLASSFVKEDRLGRWSSKPVEDHPARRTQDDDFASSDRRGSRRSPPRSSHHDRSRKPSPKEDSRQRRRERTRGDDYQKTRRDRSRSK